MLFIFRSVLLDFQLFTEKFVFWVSFCLSYDIIFIISGWKQYLSRLCYMQISYGKVCNAHVHQLTVSLILVPRGRAPFGQHQESRPLA